MFWYTYLPVESRSYASRYTGKSGMHQVSDMSFPFREIPLSCYLLSSVSTSVVLKAPT